MTKEEGNEAFKEGRWEDALRLYSEALNGLNSDDGAASCGKAALLSNKAATYQRLGRWEEAEAMCDIGLQVESTLHTKLYFRRGLENYCFTPAQSDTTTKGYGVTSCAVVAATKRSSDYSRYLTDPFLT
eukprot:gene13794-4034_t